MKTTDRNNLFRILNLVEFTGEMLFSKAEDRKLTTLTNEGILEKVAPGFYHRPELVRGFLRDYPFLLYPTA